MRIERTLRVSPDEFFDLLEEEMLAKIAKIAPSGKAPSKLTAGLVIDARNTHGERIEILEYERGKTYRSCVRGLAENVVASYAVEPVNDGIRVVFEQEGSGRNGVINGFSAMIYLGRMSVSLMDIESRVRARRVNA